MKNPQLEVAEIVAKYYVESLYTCFAYTLNNNFDFDDNQVSQAIYDVMNLMSKFDSGQLMIEDLQAELRDNNINLRFNFNYSNLNDEEEETKDDNELG